jgi:hypothetical protein
MTVSAVVGVAASLLDCKVKTTKSVLGVSSKSEISVASHVTYLLLTDPSIWGIVHLQGL